MRIFLAVALTWILAGCVATNRESAIPAPELPAATALDAPIDPANFDRERLALAIFHETNRVRREFGLPTCGWLPRLNEAADLEAAVGKVNQPPSHTNPFPMIGTPLERVKFVGLDPGQVFENIAHLTIYDVPPSVGVGFLLRDGRKIVVNPGTHEELRRSTYRRFAAEIVQAWMNSPGHRANILNPSAAYLGCSAQPGVNRLGIDQLFCVQVFFTPRL